VLRAALRGLAAHRVRLALTALAVVLGVGLVSGTFVLTDTARSGLRSVFGRSSTGVAAAVQGPQRFGVQGFASHLTVPSSLAARVARVRGVAAVQGLVVGYAQLIGRDGALIGGTAGTPTLGLSVGTVSSLESLRLRAGHFPRAPDEMVVDAATFEAESWHLGERVRVASDQPTQEFYVVGAATYGGAQDLGGATFAAFELPTAQRLLGLQGRYSVIYAAGDRGVSDAKLVHRIRAVLGKGYSIVTGAQLDAQLVNSLDRPLSFLTAVLVSLAGICLFVGSFMIFNTFSITLAQRSRELGLLRCLGASRAQVVAAVLGEAAAVGLVASLAGLGFGVIVGIGVQQLLGALGAGLPSTPPQVLPRTLLVSLAAGVGVTLAASILPALRATSLPPVAAISDNPALEPRESAGRRTAAGVPAVLIGLALVMTGLFAQSSDQAVTVGAGAATLFLGLSALSSLVARPLARAIGWPVARAVGVEGRIARQNAARNPRRSASTAAALTVGVALVSAIAVVAASARASAVQQLDQSLRADYVVAPRAAVGPQPLSEELVQRLEALPQLSVVSPVTYVTFLRGRTAHWGFAMDPDTYPSVVNLGRVEGTLRGLGPAGVAVSSKNAVKQHLRLGQSLPVVFAGHGRHVLTVRAIYPEGDDLAGYLLPRSDLALYFDDPRPTTIFVNLRPGVSATSGRSAVEAVAGAFPGVKVDDQASVKADDLRGVDQIVDVISALLALAVLLALLGVTNTLALSVLERTRELGLLRAIGMTPGQVRATVRWESAIVSVLGALPGVAIGILLGWAMQRSLAGQGMTMLQVPMSRLAIYVVAAGAAGLLAGVLPARRAARIDILRAVTTE
jgi:putative ABC transport system permease protein